MSDFDERGRRVPDYDELEEAHREKRLRHWAAAGCLCGYPDLPGSCPGPANCTMHGEEPPE